MVGSLDSHCSDCDQPGLFSRDKLSVRITTIVFEVNIQQSGVDIELLVACQFDGQVCWLWSCQCACCFCK